MVRRSKIDVQRFIMEDDKAPSEIRLHDKSIDAPETPAQRQIRLANARNNISEVKGLLAERDMREAERMRRNYQRGKSSMLNMNDLMVGIGRLPDASDVMLPGMKASHQQLTEEFPTSHDDMIMEDMARHSMPPERVQQQPRKQPQSLREIIIPRQRTNPQPAQQSTASSENWKVKRYLGETRNGNEVRVWKVENNRTGSSMPTLFRIESIAARIAMMLNESGDSNDSRVVSLINAYNKRDKLLKESRTIEKTSDGKPMKTERLRAIRAEINQLDYQLGI